MKGGRRSYAEQTRVRLLDLWAGEEAFGQPLGCVTTTFTFDAEFFEEQCLARFLSIQSNPNETAKAYLVEREEKLSQCFACVLVDRSHSAPDRSLRWNLLPVILPSSGVLHAKLTILVWEKHIRVLIGSANLTEQGYRRNQEVMAALDYGSANNPTPELLQKCVQFLDQIRQFAPGSDIPPAGPQTALAVFLQSIKKQASNFTLGQRPEADCVLLPLMPGGENVIKQLETLWKGPAPVNAWVLSPFYDKDQQAGETAEQFAAILTTKGPRRLEFGAPGRILPDGTIQIDVPSALIKSSHPSLEHRFSIVRERIVVDGNEVERPLHAKAIWLQRNDRALNMVGSSNFTAAGLGLHRNHNIELNLAYLMRDGESPFGKLCEQSWPPAQVLDELNGVQFIGGEATDSAQNSDAPLLPRAFGLALYCLDARAGRLELQIGADAPTTFEVRSREGVLVIDAAAWRRNGADEKVVVPWQTARPPSSLEVRWQDAERGDCVAIWVVNIEDVSSLPPPEELANLSLSELMEILTSARPLHEVVGRILDRRKKKSAVDDGAEVDPHKKVDTSQFLLRRMRRVALALEGMRERLQQPVGSLEALRWRLRGPIGPLALAERLAAEDPDGRAFMIAEVATTLRSVVWRPVGVLGEREIRAHVVDAIRALHELALKGPAPDNLAKYVRAAFKELLA